MHYFTWKLELVSGILWIIVAQDLHQPVIKKLKKKESLYKVFNIWVGHLSKMGTLPLFNSSVKYLLCVIDVFTTNAWVKPLKDKK